MKICLKCRKKKPRSEFNFDSGHKDGLSSWCNNCKRKLNWERRLHRYYNLTIKQYELMLKSQNGVCAICEQPETAKDRNGKIRRLSVDHNHPTGKIRGLLCHNCNRALGGFKDDPELLERAALYLKGQLCTKKKSN